MKREHGFPEVMHSAQEDLTGNISGRFSPGDWARILELARMKLSEYLDADGLPESQTWQKVVREFHQENYWGFKPDYRRTKTKTDPEADVQAHSNFGVSFILFTFLGLTLAELSIVWFGQAYTTSGESRDGWILFAVVVIVVAVAAGFLWRWRHYRD